MRKTLLWGVTCLAAFTCGTIPAIAQEVIKYYNRNQMPTAAFEQSGSELHLYLMGSATTGMTSITETPGVDSFKLKANYPIWTPEVLKALIEVESVSQPYLGNLKLVGQIFNRQDEWEYLPPMAFRLGNDASPPVTMAAFLNSGDLVFESSDPDAVHVHEYYNRLMTNSPHGVWENRFGYSFARDGDYLAVPSYNLDFLTHGVTVFKRHDYRWEAVKYIPVNYGGLGDLSLSVAIEGNILAVGDYLYRNAQNQMVGRVFIYRRITDSNWQLTDTIYGNSTLQGLGSSLALESGRLAIGKSFLSTVSIYSLKDLDGDGNWNETGEVQNVTKPAGASPAFGNRVELSADGTRLAVSDSQYPYGQQPLGCTYIYTLSGTSWALQATVTDPEGISGDSAFGCGLSSDGNLLMMLTNHTYQYPVDGVYRRRSLTFFSWNGSTWSRHSEILNPTDCVGINTFDLSADGTRAAFQVQDASDPADGDVLIYSRNGTSWTQMTTIAPSGDLTFKQQGLLIEANEVHLSGEMPNPGEDPIGLALHYRY